jgi:hypothetical protein
VSEKPLLVVLGMMGRCPFAGQTWLYANWLTALSSTGADVVYVEDDIVWPYDPDQDVVTDDCTYAVDHITRTLDRIGFTGRWAFRFDPIRKSNLSSVCVGMTDRELDELYRTCDGLLNIVGATELRDVHLAAPLKVYIETDPVTAELRLANGDELTKSIFSRHDAFVTYGENYGMPDCRVPLSGVTFLKTRQPIDLRLWTMAFDSGAQHFTTVGNYRQEGTDVEYRDEVYRWSKHHEWERVLQLPQMTGATFQLALAACPEEDRALLERHGWNVVSAREVSLDPFGAYRNFIGASRGEFTVAKDQNVRLRSGWFSERDACYLARGKPVVAQDTGFGASIPTGEGLFAFTTIEEGVDAIDRVNADYRRHCLAARRVAEEHFDGHRVASALLRDLDLL